MALAGIELWLIQASCRWSSRAVLECVRDCQLASATDMAVRVAKNVHLAEVRDSVYDRSDCRVESTERAFAEATVSCKLRRGEFGQRARLENGRDHVVCDGCIV